MTKPAGLAVGDWLVAYVFTTNGSSHSIPTPSGWTGQGQVNVPDALRRYAVFTKVADSTDVAASNFTFTSGTATTIVHLLAIQNVGRFDVFEQDTASPSSATISFTGASTPLVASSLILFNFVAHNGSGNATTSTYTSTPSLTITEQQDTFIDFGTTDPVMATASAVVSTTATVTAYGATLSISKAEHGGSILIFNPVTSPTIDVSHLVVTPDLFGVTGQASVVANISHQQITPTINGISSTVSSDKTRWQTETKPSTNWVNES